MKQKSQGQLRVAMLYEKRIFIHLYFSWVMAALLLDLLKWKDMKSTYLAEYMFVFELGTLPVIYTFTSTIYNRMQCTFKLQL